MVDVDVTLRLGMFNRVAFWQQTVPDALVEQFQEQAAEFEVLEMALHDQHYATGQFGAVLGSGLSLPAPFESDDERTASTDVIGNIGEGLGMATLCTAAGFFQDEVARIRRQKQRQHSIARRIPDFSICGRAGIPVARRLERLAAYIAYPDEEIEFRAAVASFPERFPVESKASMGVSGSQWSAVWQLVEYWNQVLLYAPGSGDLGYGLLVETNGVGEAQRSVVVTVLAPSDITMLRSQIQNLEVKRGTRKAFARQFNQSWGPFVGH